MQSSSSPPSGLPTFEDAFAAVTEGRAALGMIPIENTIAGRVADIHHLLPEAGLHIIGEHFERVRHQLLAVNAACLLDAVFLAWVSSSDDWVGGAKAALGLGGGGGAPAAKA